MEKTKEIKIIFKKEPDKIYVKTDVEWEFSEGGRYVCIWDGAKTIFYNSDDIEKIIYF